MISFKIAIVGLGVVGGSFAKAFQEQSQHPVTVYGIDTNLETLYQAYSEGVISNQTCEDAGDILAQADMVILTLYPNDLVTFLQKYNTSFKEHAILADVTGIKSAIIEKVLAVLPPQVDFIFGHPMAGKESRGYAYADGRVFQGANYLITPVERNLKANLVLFETFMQALGFKRVTYIDSSDHDKLIAYTSQLCHVLAVSLINSKDYNQEVIRFVGDSFRDLTRIAKINEDLWAELFLHNKENLVERIENVEEEVARLKQALLEENSLGLKVIFKEATERRKDLEAQDHKIRN